MGRRRESKKRGERGEAEFSVPQVSRHADDPDDSGTLGTHGYLANGRGGIGATEA